MKSGEKTVNIKTVEILGQKLKVSTDLTDEEFMKVVEVVSKSVQFFKEKIPEARVTEILILTCLKIAEDYVKAVEKERNTIKEVDIELNRLIKLFEKERGV